MLRDTVLLIIAIPLILFYIHDDNYYRLRTYG